MYKIFKSREVNQEDTASMKTSIFVFGMKEYTYCVSLEKKTYWISLIKWSRTK
jgi:hypothetical protein